jgi:ceramide glucosyltransferase
VPGPFVQPLGTRSFAQVWSRQVRWARLRRVTFKLYFAPELIMGALFPFAAAVFLALVGVIPAWATVALPLAWYGAEAFLVRAAGWQLTARSPAAWVARDLLLAPLWFAAWAGNGFNWRGHTMTVAAEETESPLSRLFERFARIAIEGDDVEPRSAWAATIARRWRGWRARSGD